jgi:hypothetical protein
MIGTGLAGNQNPYIEEEQTTQWPEEKVQKDKQRSAKQTHKTKERVTRISLKTGVEFSCSGRVSQMLWQPMVYYMSSMMSSFLMKASYVSRMFEIF